MFPWSYFAPSYFASHYFVEMSVLLGHVVRNAGLDAFLSFAAGIDVVGAYAAGLDVFGAWPAGVSDAVAGSFRAGLDDVR